MRAREQFTFTFSFLATPEKKEGTFTCTRRGASNPGPEQTMGRIVGNCRPLACFSLSHSCVCVDVRGKGDNATFVGAPTQSHELARKRAKEKTLIIEHVHKQLLLLTIQTHFFALALARSRMLPEYNGRTNTMSRTAVYGRAEQLTERITKQPERAQAAAQSHNFNSFTFSDRPRAVAG
jgi:hypothetical protein